MDTIIETSDAELRSAQLALLAAKTRAASLEADAQEISNVSLRHQLESLEAGPEHALIFTFYNPVVGVTVVDAITTLDRWSRRKPGAPIEIIFCSPGGTVSDGFALFDFITELRARGHKITTKCIGVAASMGAILMQAGDERVMTRNAFLMVHEVSSEGRGSLAELADHLKMVERFQAKGLDILTERATIARDDLAARWKKTDWYLDAEEALSLGLIDRIV